MFREVNDSFWSVKKGVDMKTCLDAVRVAAAIGCLSFAAICTAQDLSVVTPKTAPSGIEYVNGGIGQAQQAAMHALRSKYNFRLTLAKPRSGEYVADVNVRVENSKKDAVLDVDSAGPLLFANLPSGRYTLVTKYQGHSKSQPLTMKSGRPHGVVVYFPDAP
jgi:hypothetical protein